MFCSQEWSEIGLILEAFFWRLLVTSGMLHIVGTGAKLEAVITVEVNWSAAMNMLRCSHLFKPQPLKCSIPI